MAAVARCPALWLCVAIAVASPAHASWQDIVAADAEFDLAAAAGRALEVVAGDPQSPEAVAAAGWWLERLADLPDAGRVESAVREPRDPELALALAQIEGLLAGRPPAGSLATAELAGPFGIFPRLDLERAVVPADRELPPPGTRWLDPWSPFRLRLRTATGRVAPPEPLYVDGVYLAAWDLLLPVALDGWLAVECSGGVNLEVGDQPVGRLRDCGVVDPGTAWFRVHLDAGRHRIRAEIGSPQMPWLRLSLFDDHGRPVAAGTAAADDRPLAAARIERALPPAAARLGSRLEAAPSVEDLLLAASLARMRRDPRSERELLERASSAAPDRPLVRLALAAQYLDGGAGATLSRDVRRARSELRGCASLPLCRLYEYQAARREQRAEDAERFLTELVTAWGDDPRVVRLWVGEAVRQGWIRELEDGLDRLASLLPDPRSTAELRLAALSASERFGERRALLRALIRDDVLAPRLVEELAAGCLVDEAITAMERLRRQVDDPGLDLAMAGLHLDRGEQAAAAAVLAEAAARWGELPAFDRLQLEVAAAGSDALSGALERALERSPGDLGLHALAWRRGAAPFFAPFCVELADVAAADAATAGTADVVLLLDQAVELVARDGTSLYYYHGISRAATPVGARQASLLQPLPGSLWLRLRIHKPDGRVVVPAVLDPRADGLEISGVAPGDLVEEEYVAAVAESMTVRRGHLSPYVYRFADPERAFGRSEYVLLVPDGLELDIDGNFVGLDRQEWSSSGQRVIRWRAETMAPIPPEPLGPPNQELLPWVSYGFGVTWQDVGDAVRDRALAVLATDQELERWSEPLLAETDAERAVRALLAAVYDEVEAGRSVLTLASNAGESFAERAGNRLGIVAGALAAAGFEVDLVLARPRPFAGTHLAVPTLDTFTVPVLRVARGGGEIWIDVEQEQRGALRLRPILQGSDGLLLPLTRPAVPVELLDELPVFSNPELEQRIAVRAAVLANGDARIDFRLPVRGAEAERLRERVETVSVDRARAEFEQMASNLFPGAVDVRGELTATDAGYEVHLEMAVAGACDADRDALVCRSLVIARPLVPVLASLPERRFPLVLETPIQRRYDVEITAPDGWFIDRRPRRVQARWGLVDERLERTGDRFSSTLSVDIPAQTVDPADYPEFARFCHAVDELVSRPPRLVAGGCDGASNNPTDCSR